MQVTGSERLHALDAVRGFALILGVFFHATMSFLPGPQAWMVMDAERSTALGVTFFTLHMFRMTTFFLIAGFFARLVYHRRGWAGFAADRAKRIALPLVVFWPIVFAGIVAGSIWAAMVMYGPDNMPAPPTPPQVPFAFPLTHLWFLYVLLIFYAIALAVRGLVALVDRGGALRRGLDWIVRMTAGSPIAPLLLAIPAFIAFALNPGWLLWTGIPTPDSSFIPNAIAFTAYGFAFTLGWLLHRQIPLMNRWKQMWPFYFVAALALTGACLTISGGVSPNFLSEPNQMRALAFAGAYATAGWCYALGFVGLSLHVFAKFSAWRRYIADASYWIYIMHLPLVLALQVAISQLPVHWAAKYVFVVAATLAILLTTYQLLVRYSFIGAMLNGRKHPRRASKATKAQPTQAEGSLS